LRAPPPLLPERDDTPPRLAGSNNPQGLLSIPPRPFPILWAEEREMNGSERRAFGVVCAAILGSALSVGATRATADCGSGVTRLGGTWLVSPNGVDDTHAVQCALDEAVAAGPGRTVQLQAGTFHVGFIRVRGFVGVFRGRGMDATRITPLPALACAEELARGLSPVLLAFDEGFPRISDLMLEITADQVDPCVPYSGWWDPEPLSGFGELLTVGGAPITEVDADNCDALAPATAGARIERIRIKGPFPATAEVQQFGARHYVEHGLSIGGWGNYGVTFCPDWVRRVNGAFTVEGSLFEDLPSAGVGASGLGKATVRVGGSPRASNRFRNVGFSFVAMTNDGAMLDFSYNDSDTQCLNSIYDVQSIPYNQGPPLAPSTLHVHHNKLRVGGTAEAVTLMDFAPLAGAPATLRATIAHNTLTLADTTAAGIGSYGAQKVKIYGNTITGNGLAGIYAGIFGDPSDGWWIVGNDVSGVNMPPATAPIWLGATTKSFLVVGDGHPTAVLDQGTHNVLINVDRLEPTP
jgi:hypothetical protein